MKALHRDFLRTAYLFICAIICHVCFLSAVAPPVNSVLPASLLVACALLFLEYLPAGCQGNRCAIRGSAA